MNQTKARRKEIRSRVLVYVCMTASVILLVAALLFVVEGYKYDVTTKRVEQGALVQFNSVPSGATVEVNGKALGGKTATKTSVTAGKHEFVMWREGYETWRKTLNLEAGSLTWLNYARLIPKSRPISSQRQFDTIANSLASPSGKYMVLQQDSASPDILVANLQSKQITYVNHTLDSAVYSAADTTNGKHAFDITSWDDGGRYLLIKHIYSDSTEWLVYDTNDKTTKNLSKTVGIDLSNVVFAGNDANILYALNDGNLRKIDTSSGTISRVLVSNVAGFTAYQGKILTYVTQPDKETGKREIGFYRDGDDNTETIATIPADVHDPAHIEAATYLGTDYVAYSLGKTVTFLGGDFPTRQTSNSLRKLGALSLSSDITNLTFNGVGRIVVVQAGADFGTYDFERKSSYKGSTEGAQKLYFLDNFYLWSDNNDTLLIRDFENGNVTNMGQIKPNQAVTLTQDGRYLYGIGSVDQKNQLQRIQMIL